MFLINCPYCGERDQQEFKAGGEAHIERPKQPTELSDDENGSIAILLAQSCP